MVKKEKKRKIDKPQDKTSIDSRILTMFEELALESEKKQIDNKKEYGMTLGHIAEELGIHANTLRDRIYTYQILEDLKIKIRLIEDGKGRTVVIVSRDKGTLKELYEEIEKIKSTLKELNLKIMPKPNAEI